MLSCLHAPRFVLEILCPAGSRGKEIQPTASQEVHRQRRTDAAPPCRFSVCATASLISFPVPSESFRATLPQWPPPHSQKTVQSSRSPPQIYHHRWHNIKRVCFHDGILAFSQEAVPARMPARAYACSLFARQVDNVV